MRKIVLFIAMSLDGYIANTDGGIRLFDAAKKELKLKLIESKSYNGITDLVYERR